MRLHFSLSLAIFWLSLSSSNAQSIVYVDRNATGLNNGSSWTNAATDMLTGIALANPGDELWIAKGDYFATNDNDPNKYIPFTKNIQLFGGFNGTETTRLQRNYVSNVTTFSGDIGVIGDSTDNSANFFRITNQSGLIVIDGITFRHLNSFLTSGGAVHIDKSTNVKFQHCIFTKNYSDFAGGAALFINQLSKVTIDSCQFTENKVRLGGGAILAKDTSELVITHSLFNNNYSPGNGSSITSTKTKVKILFTTFDFTNPIPINQSIVYDYQNSLHDTAYYFNNCSFSNIQSAGSAFVLFNNVKNVYFENTTFDNNNFTASLGCTVNFYGKSIQFKSCSIKNNLSTGQQLLYLSTTTGGIQFDSLRCLNNTGANYVVNAFGKKITLNNCEFSNNQASYAHLYTGGLDTAVISNSIFKNNTNSTQYMVYCGSKYVSAINNEFTGNQAFYSAFSCSGTTLNLHCQNNTFTNNTGTFGGALNIYTNASTSLIKGCTFSTNSALNSGGAITIGGSGKVSLSTTTFNNNNADMGGAIQCYNNADIAYCTFIGNKAAYGATPSGLGGAINAGGTAKLTLTKCKFENNSGKEGGAIYTEDSLFINRSYFNANKVAGAIQKGAAINSKKFTRSINCKWYKNNCDSNGTIYNKGNLELYNCTMADNGKSGAVVNRNGGNTLINTLVNSIFWNNGDTTNIVGQPLVSVKNYYNCIANEYLGTSNSFQNPLLDIELRISPNSPAIDEGVLYPFLPPIDYDSTARIKLVTIDIGAHEVSQDDRIFNVLTGYTYIDANDNCIFDPANGDIALPNVPIKIAPLFLFTNSDATGKYELKVKPGNYTITAPLVAPISGNFNLTCPIGKSHLVSFSGFGGVANGNDFGYKEKIIIDCKYDLAVYASAAAHRPCSTSTISVVANNNTNELFLNPLLTMIFPADVFLKSASHPYVKKNDTLEFLLGPLPAFSSITIQLVDSVSCSLTNVLTQTRCFVYTIKETSTCIPPLWDKSNLALSSLSDSYCTLVPFGTSIKITNIGEGDMADSTEIRITEANTIIKRSKIKLKKMNSFVVSLPGSSSYFEKIIEVDETAYHPVDKMEVYTVMPCLPLVVLPYYTSSSVLHLNPYPAQTVKRSSARSYTQCIPINNSYDPNAIEVTPAGIPTENYVFPDLDMDYTIHFQNTGTDTAFTVVLVDTLDANLDINTLRLGASSHPYSYSLSGAINPILKIRFDAINLVDSSKSYTASCGHISYFIRQLEALPDYTPINATAGIYFDYNDAVLTNTANVTIKRTSPENLGLGQTITISHSSITEVETATTKTPSTIALFPNPTLGEVMVTVAPLLSGEKKLLLFRSDGYKVKEFTFESNAFTFPVNDLNIGMYFYKIISNGSELIAGKIIVGK